MLSMGKRLTGGEYERAGEEDEEERRRSIERRARETPSAIYAHKSVDVSVLLRSSSVDLI
jgi:Ca2+-transporting ATPase